MWTSEIMRIGIGMCGDPSIVLIYGTCRMENCIVVLIEVVSSGSYFVQFQVWDIAN
jgi:hypothetical protein